MSVRILQPRYFDETLPVQTPEMQQRMLAAWVGMNRFNCLESDIVAAICVGSIQVLREVIQCAERLHFVSQALEIAKTVVKVKRKRQIEENKRKVKHVAVRIGTHRDREKQREI